MNLKSTLFYSLINPIFLQGAMSSLGLKDCYVGSQAQRLRGILSISHPIRQGVVQDWDDLETIWSHIVENELKTDTAAQPMLVTQMPLASRDDETKMAEILMEKMNVPAMFIANKSVMSLYGGGNMTGISVDSGHDTTYLGINLEVINPGLTWINLGSTLNSFVNIIPISSRL